MANTGSPAKWNVSATIDDAVGPLRTYRAGLPGTHGMVEGTDAAAGTVAAGTALVATAAEPGAPGAGAAALEGDTTTGAPGGPLRPDGEPHASSATTPAIETQTEQKIATVHR